MRRLLALVALLLAIPAVSLASDAEKPVMRHYPVTPPAPATQTAEEAQSKSAGCLSCHTATDALSMHKSDAVVLGCADCHGGDATVTLADRRLKPDDPAYRATLSRAHVMPRFPKAWNWPSSANPRASYTLLNKESPEFVRFVNPSDYRVARESCGACHMEVIQAAERSIMASGAMLWGGASYNNGIVPFKNYVFGEAYTREGEPAKIVSPGDPPGTVTPEQKARGALPALYPLPTWHVVPPADIFRVFERGGRNISTGFAEVGIPNSTGSIQRLEEPGRPDLKQSNRGPGTGLRVAIPVLNIHKTRLNDPFTWFLGTNDQPGDYRSSGCASCHVVYANDREPRHSSVWAKYGRDGQTATIDPTIKDKLEGPPDHHDVFGSVAVNGDATREPGQKEKGHPVEHAFTRAIPTSQCMTCHMHQPNIFLNSFLGYTMWDYESDAPAMWGDKQAYPTAEMRRRVLDRNPEMAATHAPWADLDVLRNTYDKNPGLKDTQFADYHGHGWNFRAIFKRDREGNLLDAEGKIVSPDDPEKWRKNGEGKFVPVGTNPGKTVHMMDIHAEKGMQCADCHFAQDNHGNGLIMTEVANAVEIGCKDCHGTADKLPTLLTSGPAAPPGGTNLTLARNPDGQRRFEWSTDDSGRQVLVQRSASDPKLEWRVHLVKDSVDPTYSGFNIKAARAKLMGLSDRMQWGPGVPASARAHGDDKMTCFTCHLSWTTSCGGCHLPIEANWKTTSHKYGGEETRNWASYNPQVARDDMFQLGRHQTTKGNIIAPVRSTSALVLSSTNVNRERIYIQQPPISAIGFSSQAFAPHFPHTVRTTETKTCSDCHLSAAEDNNAIMSQLMLLGTNFVNFVGMNAWTGLAGGFEAIRVTEWEEPQAVIGSYLQRWAYPDYYKQHLAHDRELIDWQRGTVLDKHLSGETNAPELFRNVVQGTSDAANCLQLRGEYMFVAEGRGGFRAYDVASIANKGFSNPIVSAPFSKLGQDLHIASPNATCMALPTDQPIAPTRNTQAMRDANQEQAFHPIYHYAVITDAVEGLILANVDTLADGEFRNNRLTRALTWNPGGVLTGARHITLAGHIAYVTTPHGLAVIDLDDPLKPVLTANIPLDDARATAVQFRYLWVTTQQGLKLFDVTDLTHPQARPSGDVALADAHRVYIARTYAYVAGGAEGLVIVNVTKPMTPVIYRKETFGGKMNDARDVIVGSTNASLFAYVADGKNGLKVIQLTSPASQPNFYGFSPAPMPELIAWAKTPSPALALSKGLDRDRAVDETGGQIAVFGRLGSRPFTRSEMERLFLGRRGVPYKVVDTASMADYLK
ncbi:Cytochrome c domain-containing protein [Sphingomonas antarctica]|uniref:multiheme c-type cytochrome n=1 Tax=Sphingomonas antarctica TaxID=2040274 RepID=UPI0039E7CFB3